jgi:hypothetical protein
MVESINDFFTKSQSDQAQPQSPDQSQSECSDQKIRPLKIQKNKNTLSLKSSRQNIDSLNLHDVEPDTGRSMGSENINTPKFLNRISNDELFPLTNFENSSGKLRLSSSLKKQIYFSKKSETSMAEDRMDLYFEEKNRETGFEILSGQKSGIEDSGFSITRIDKLISNNNTLDDVSDILMDKIEDNISILKS